MDSVISVARKRKQVMGEFDDALIATAPAFTDTFAETITYKPNGSDPREIEAIVTRDPPAPLPDAPHGHAPKMLIDVENSDETGISTDEIDIGLDLVSVAVRVGKDAQNRSFAGIVSQDAGRVIYGVN